MEEAIKLVFKANDQVLSLVFNDHFVIALLFLLGGISYTYSNFIKSLNVDLSYPWAKPVVIIVLLVMLQFGKVEVGGQAVLGRQHLKPTPWLTGTTWLRSDFAMFSLSCASSFGKKSEAKRS